MFKFKFYVQDLLLRLDVTVEGYIYSKFKDNFKTKFEVNI
jgi:hypothetical protein